MPWVGSFICSSLLSKVGPCNTDREAHRLLIGYMYNQGKRVLSVDMRTTPSSFGQPASLLSHQLAHAARQLPAQSLHVGSWRASHKAFDLVRPTRTAPKCIIRPPTPTCKAPLSQRQPDLFQRRRAADALPVSYADARRRAPTRPFWDATTPYLLQGFRLLWNR